MVECCPRGRREERRERKGKKEEGRGRGKEEPAVGKSQSVTIFFLPWLSISLAWLPSFQLRHVPVHFAVHGLAGTPRCRSNKLQNCPSKAKKGPQSKTPHEGKLWAKLQLQGISSLFLRRCCAVDCRNRPTRELN